MYTTIGNKALKRKTCNLAAQWVKGRKHNSLRCIIYNQVNTGSCFNSADITSFTTNDLPFYFITLKVENCYGIFNGLFSTCTLDRLNDDLSRFFISTQLCIFY